MAKVRVATAYLQIEGKDPGPGYDYGHKAIVRSVHNKAPRSIHPGCIVVKVQLRIPVEAWEPFSPEAIIDVPTDLVHHPVEVEAVAADD